MSYKLYTDWAEKNPHSLVLLEVSDGYISYDEGASALFRLTDQPLQKPNKKEKALGYTIAIPRNYYPILLDDMSKLRISYMVARGDYQVYRCEFEPEYFDAYGKLINFGDKPTDKKFDRGIGLYDTVVVKNLATRKYIVWQIVPEEEATDLGREQSGKLSHHTVMGHALIGHLAGDEIPVSRSDIDNSTYRVIHIQDTKGNNLVKHFKKKSPALQTMQEDEAEALKLIAALKSGELTTEAEGDENKEPQLALTADGKVDISVLLKNKQSSSYDTSHEQIDASEISTEDEDEEEETLISLKNYKKKVKKQPEKKVAAPKAAEKPSAPLSGNPEIPGSGPVVWSGVKMPKKKEKVEKELDLVDEKAIEKQQAKEAKKQEAFEKKQAALKEKQKKKDADLKRKQRVQDVKKAAADAKKQAVIDAKAQKELEKKQKEFDKLNKKPKKQKEKKAKKGDLVWGSAEEVAATLGETGEALQGILAEDIAAASEAVETSEIVAAEAVESVVETAEDVLTENVETKEVLEDFTDNENVADASDSNELLPEADDENEGSEDDISSEFDEMFAETDENPFETVVSEEESAVSEENVSANDDSFGEVTENVANNVQPSDAGWNLTGKKQKKAKKEKKPFVWPWKRKKMEAEAAAALAAEATDEEVISDAVDEIPEDSTISVETETLPTEEAITEETIQDVVSEDIAETDEMTEDNQEENEESDIPSEDAEFIESLEGLDAENIDIFNTDDLDTAFTDESNPFDKQPEISENENIEEDAPAEVSVDEDFINALSEDNNSEIAEPITESEANISSEDSEKILAEILGVSLEQSVFDRINSTSNAQVPIAPVAKSGKARRFKTKQRYASRHNR